MEHDRKIGIIGGMGPAATWLFYRYVTEMTEASCRPGSRQYGDLK